MGRKLPEDRELKAGPRHPSPGKLCQPSSKWVPFSNRRMIKQQKERDEPRLSFVVPKIQQVTNLHDCLSYCNIFFYSRGAEGECENKLFFFSHTCQIIV